MAVAGGRGVDGNGAAGRDDTMVHIAVVGRSPPLTADRVRAMHGRDVHRAYPRDWGEPYPSRMHAVAAHAYLLGVAGAAISVVTWMEVMTGASSPEEEAAIRGFLAAFVVLPVDAAVAEEAVGLRRARRLKLPDAIL